MRRSELRWAEVRVGLFVALAALVLFAGIIYMGLAGSPFSQQPTLYGMFDDISGLAVGSSVEMGGLRVGEISKIDLPDLETGKMPVAMSVDPAAFDKLGPSSVAFTSSHALVGQRFIGLTPRRPDEPPLRPGDSIRTRKEAQLSDIAEEAQKLITQLEPTLRHLQRASSALAGVLEGVSEGKGTLGRLITDEELYDRLNAAAANLSDLTERAAHGPGPLAALVGDRRMAEDLRSGVGALAQTARRIRQGKGLIGRLTNDAKTEEQFDHTTANLAAVSERLSSAQGTLGALINDPAMLARFNDLIGEVDRLITDVRRNPSRYVRITPF